MNRTERKRSCRKAGSQAERLLQPALRSQPGPAGRWAECVVVLVRPESPENIGLAARAMKNTGFANLRLAGLDEIGPAAFRTAVHAGDILSSSALFTSLKDAVADLNVVFASTARKRRNFSALDLDAAVAKMLDVRPPARIGLVFGNERTGLTSAELAVSNFRFTIPQALPQPSYNLAAAVLVTLYEIFRRRSAQAAGRRLASADVPLPFSEQDECIRLILRKLEDRRFIHATNARHATEMVRDLVGRLAITARDRRLLLAMFSHAGRGPADRD